MSQVIQCRSPLTDTELDSMVIPNPTKLTVKLDLSERLHQKLRVIYKTVNDSHCMRADWYRQNSRANVSWLTQSGWKSLYAPLPMVSKWNPRTNRLKAESENWWVWERCPMMKGLLLCVVTFTHSQNLLDTPQRGIQLLFWTRSILSMAHASHLVNSGIHYGGIVFYVKDLPKHGGEDMNLQNH